MTIVFLDASALFSAALSATGGSRELLHLGFLGKLHLVISPFVVEETPLALSGQYLTIDH